MQEAITDHGHKCDVVMHQVQLPDTRKQVAQENASVLKVFQVAIFLRSESNDVLYVNIPDLADLEVPESRQIRDGKVFEA